MVNLEITGLYDSKTAYSIAKMLKGKKGRSLVIVSSNVRAQSLASDLSFFVEKNINIIESDEDFLTLYEAKNRESLYERISSIGNILQNEDDIVIIPGNSLLRYVVPRKVFSDSQIHIKTGDILNLEELGKRLVFMGYDRVKMVYGRGQFAFRGSIIDIFPPANDRPFRIELFDTEVESIKSFDEDSQLSIEKLTSIDINPATLMIYREKEVDRFRTYIKNEYKGLKSRAEELLDLAKNRNNLQQLEFYLSRFYEEKSTIFEYINPENIFVEDVLAIEDNISFLKREFKASFVDLLESGKVVKSDFDNIGDINNIQEVFDNNDVTLLSPKSEKIHSKNSVSRSIDCKLGSVTNYNGDRKTFERELRAYGRQGYSKVYIVCENEQKKTNIEEILRECSDIKIDIEIVLDRLSKGLVDKEEKLIYITDIEILGGFHKKRNIKAKKYRNTKAIHSFTDIKNGDYVVHEDHGVGQFLGIVQLVVDDIPRDLIHIKYAGDDVLYVPVDQLNRVQKYIGSDAAPPKIYKLSGRDWENTKNRAKNAILEIAKEIIEVSAIRKAEKGFKFSEDNQWQKDFENSFPYEETDDQLKCISEIKADMEREEAMDRLLCGDVGYGKTEVAARAMFKCVMDGKQVAMLVPTTILADQHYKTLKSRFEGFPVNIQMLSRFRSSKEQKETVEALKKGQVDIVVGTHRLLSKDVKYKDLGLLVIDEEQRFGVSHKEKIKFLKENIDVLTLSATPIPRTLHMSLVGIRNMSLIEEPPHDRIPVQTYVVEEEDYIIKEAIQRELGRGGQVFIVSNRVQGIERLADRIQKLAPQSKISIAHGQMSEKDLEDTMMEFIEGETQILITTTIIESGIDISNANTMIVIDSDKFGLSQLYQLRGRIGRSNKVAYAYLTHKKDKVLSEVSEKRLRAIREFTEFGAGFKIAMRDLEIRGAGNILGSKQSGHIISVGYELYTKLVQEAVAAIKGEIISEEKDDLKLEMKVPAYIPNSYIRDESIKFDIYRKIAESGREGREKELMAHLEDRFGNLPPEVINLIKVSTIRHFAALSGIKRIAEIDDKILIQFEAKEEKPIRLWKSATPLDDVLDVVTMLGGKTSGEIS